MTASSFAEHFDLSASDAATLEGAFDLLTVPAGKMLVQRGDTERSLYYVVSGEAVGRGPRDEAEPLGAGRFLGHMQLIVGVPWTWTVEARTDLTVQRLSHGRLSALARQAPGLTEALVRGLVGGVAPGAAGPVAEPPTTFEIVLAGQVHHVPAGTSWSAVLPTELDHEPVVAALVDRRATSLVAPVTGGGTVEPLTTAHWEGSRIYRRSIGLMLLEAARRLDPTLDLRLEHSLGYAQRVRAPRGAGGRTWVELAEALNAEMFRLVDERRPSVERWWTVDYARTWFAKRGWDSAAGLLQVWREPTVGVVSFGEVHALRVEPIVPHTGMLAGFCVVAAGDGLVLVHGVVDDLEQMPRGRTVVAPALEQSSTAALIARRSEVMMRDHARWLETLGVADVAALNRACIDGEVETMVRVAEGHHEKRIGQIADAIAARLDRVRVVTIAGPSSSGKSTFIQRLRTQLLVAGVRPRELSLDDYYQEHRFVPRDAAGELDFEAFEALRTDLLGEHLGALLAGETVRTARFDFRTHRSDPTGGPELSVGAGDVLLIEGIHGLNPRLLPQLQETEAFRVFVAPLAQLPFDRLGRVHASDLRLLRRIVRDRHGRGTDAAETITRWPSVRDGERRHIFAYQHHADEVFDSSLAYEVAVLRVLAERYLLEVPQGHPAYTTAYRLLRVLDRFVTVAPDVVPGTSILREFIG